MHHGAACSIYSLSHNAEASSTDMLRILSLAIAVLIVAASAADASYCGQSSELAAAHARWAALRQSRVGPAEADTLMELQHHSRPLATRARQTASRLTAPNTRLPLQQCGQIL